MATSAAKKMTIDYLTQTKAGSWKYRRKVPAELRAQIGVREFVKVLGRSPAEARRNYDQYHDEVEMRLATARGATTTAKPTELHSAIDAQQEAMRRLAALGINLNKIRYTEAGEFTEGDALLETYQVKDAADTEVVRLLSGGGKIIKPAATFGDAVRRYVADKIEGTVNEGVKTQRIDRVTAYVLQAIGLDKRLEDFTREDARAVVAEMLATGNAAATVHRYLNDVKAIVAHGIRELTSGNVVNHFVKLPVKGYKPQGHADRDERHPFTDEQLKVATRRIEEHAGHDLRIIWTLLSGTGARLSEVCGLERGDVVLDGTDIPHLRIKFNGIRRLKNEASIRLLPLIGSTVEAARSALGTVDSTKKPLDAPLFPSYGRERGGDSASKILNKHIRKVVSDTKVTVHSLRHTMMDRLIAAGVSEHDRKLILGHAIGGEGNRYGSDAARLAAASKAIEAVLS